MKDNHKKQYNVGQTNGIVTLFQFDPWVKWQLTDIIRCR